MHLKLYSFLFLFFILLFNLKAQKIIVAAEQTENYLPQIKGKKIALVVNQTSNIGKVHLVDSLKKLGCNILSIFAPEHGFRGDASAGTHVKNGLDEKTGIKIISLYGNHKKPTKLDLQNIETVVFDIQDVGVRFYTYISTMHYVMEACAENNIPFMVLDRPNPNGHYIDGPVLDTNFRSFVGMHAIPLVHGCTVGEIALMINGEGWLAGKIKCNLTIVKCKNYTHQTPYNLPIKPSPNLQTQSAIYLYPSLGLFEGTPITIGHGTKKPYQLFGSSEFGWGNDTFRPYSIKGVVEKPKFLGIVCKGFDLTNYGFTKAYSEKEINLNWLIVSYKNTKDKTNFFTPFFNQLAGTNKLKKAIIEGKNAAEIKQTWQADLEKYKQMRTKYLLYL